MKPGASSLRLRGNLGLYRNLLERFATQFASGDQPLQDALAQQDWVNAHRWAHTLKGLAANIGANALQDAAQALERGLQGEQPRDALALAEPTARALLHVLDAIAHERANRRALLHADATASPAPGAELPSCASSTPPTKPTTVPAARPEARSSPTAASPASSAKTGPAPWKNWKPSSEDRKIGTDSHDDGYMIL